MLRSFGNLCSVLMHYCTIFIVPAVYSIIHSFTVGGFGIDRFYLEQWGTAVGKLVTFGGLGVWSILDVILIATGYLTPGDGSSYVY